jgi:hypothetical protein
MWSVLEPRIESVRRDLARDFGCDAEEMAITRNASEALETLIFGLDLKAGDEVLVTNQNYGRMLTSWDQRVRREGIVLKQVSFPVPASHPPRPAPFAAAAPGRRGSWSLRRVQSCLPFWFSWPRRRPLFMERVKRDELLAAGKAGFSCAKLHDKVERLGQKAGQPAAERLPTGVNAGLPLHADLQPTGRIAQRG